MGVVVLITNYDVTIILLFEKPLFILITFIKLYCIFVLKKLHFGGFMGQLLPPCNSLRTALHMKATEDLIHAYAMRRIDS